MISCPLRQQSDSMKTLQNGPFSALYFNLDNSRVNSILCKYLGSYHYFNFLFGNILFLFFSRLAFNFLGVPSPSPAPSHPTVHRLGNEPRSCSLRGSVGLKSSNRLPALPGNLHLIRETWRLMELKPRMDTF